MNGKQRQLLLVEDHGDTAKVLSRLLDRWGYKTIIARSAAEALQYCRNQRFSLLICDIGLPDGDGWGLMKQIRKMYDVPGIALSGYGGARDRQASAEAGFAEHLLKPVTADQLVSAVQRVTGERTDMALVSACVPISTHSTS